MDIRHIWEAKSAAHTALAFLVDALERFQRNGDIVQKEVESSKSVLARLDAYDSMSDPRDRKP